MVNFSMEISEKCAYYLYSAKYANLPNLFHMGN